MSFSLFQNSLLSLDFFARLQSISEFQAALELTLVTGTFLLLVCTHDTFQIKIRKAFLYKCVCVCVTNCVTNMVCDEEVRTGEAEDWRYRSKNKINKNPAKCCGENTCHGWEWCLAEKYESIFLWVYHILGAMMMTNHPITVEINACGYRSQSSNPQTGCSNWMINMSWN